MLEGQKLFLGEEIHSIIYGCGKNIEKSLEEYKYTVEDYLLKPIKMLYWGDIDYEGIGIYERLKRRYSGIFDIELFKEAYIAMVKLSEKICLPSSSEKQNKNIEKLFLEELKPYEGKIIKLLEEGVYKSVWGS
jgi:hypothetical protein